MWCGFFGSTGSFIDEHAGPDWPNGFRGRTANLRAYIMYFQRGYPHVADGPIRVSGWYALRLHEFDVHPFGPFPSRIAASAWWQRWLDTPGSWRKTWAWRTTPDAVYASGPIPRDTVAFRRLAPSYGVKPPRARQPRRANFPRSTSPRHVLSGY